MLTVLEPMDVEQLRTCVLYLEDRLSEGHRNADVVARWRRDVLRMRARILTLQNEGQSRRLAKAS
jgi:hypothetical protein